MLLLTPKKVALVNQANLKSSLKYLDLSTKRKLLSLASPINTRTMLVGRQSLKAITSPERSNQFQSCLFEIHFFVVFSLPRATTLHSL